MSARATHSPGPAHPTLSRCHGRHAPIPVTDESAEKLQNCTRSTRVQSKAKTPNHTRPTDPTAHPKFHKSISTRPTQPNPQIDSTTPVTEEANDSMNTAIGTHSHSNPLQGSRWFQTGAVTSVASKGVSIRFEVRGGFRPTVYDSWSVGLFQSALRFAVVSDVGVRNCTRNDGFQSALRFAVVSDGSLPTISTSPRCFNPL